MKLQVSHRLDQDLLAWATRYGESRHTSRAVIIEEALRHFQALTEGGVPDLPVDTPATAAAARLEAPPVESYRQQLGAKQIKLNEAAARARGWR